jgi:hypothetical protein
MLGRSRLVIQVRIPVIANPGAGSSEVRLLKKPLFAGSRAARLVFPFGLRTE